MIRWYPLLFLVLPAATCVHWRSDAERFGLTDEQLNAPPPRTRIKGAILNDVIIWRGLRDKLDEGQPTCSMVIVRDGVTICARDEEAFEIYVLSSNLPDEHINNFYDICHFSQKGEKEFIELVFNQ